jgi:hypothetical protein
MTEFTKRSGWWYAPDKDPNAILDYSIDWSDWLDTDEISTSTWTVPTGITKTSESNTTTVATIWLSGGTAGTTYTLLDRITTTGGRTMDQTFKIYVKEL